MITEETTDRPHVSARLPEMKFCLTTEAFCLCLPMVECLWQDFNDSSSAAFWQASLAVDETNKSTVKSSLLSQDQTFHLNILLGSKWGDSLNSYLDFDVIIRKKEHFFTEHPCAPSAGRYWRTGLELCWVFCVVSFFGRTDLIYLDFQGLWVSALNTSSVEGKWAKHSKLGRNKFYLCLLPSRWVTLGESFHLQCSQLSSAGVRGTVSSGPQYCQGRPVSFLYLQFQL